jgi:hypothetical protein
MLLELPFFTVAANARHASALNSSTAPARGFGVTHEDKTGGPTSTQLPPPLPL